MCSSDPPRFPGLPRAMLILFFVSIFLVIEWFGREQQYAIAQLDGRWNKPLRWTMYYTIIFAILYFAGKEQQFIYFQF